MPEEKDHEIIVGDQETPRLLSSKQPPSSSWCFSWFSQLLSIFLRSLRIIFLENPRVFLSIYVFTSLPLSLLLAALSISSRRLKAHIARLEWLSRVAEIWMEADNVREESSDDLHSLLRLKALYGIPICIFSLLSLTATVSAAVKRRPLLPAVKSTMARPAITCVVNYGALIAWEVFAHVVTAAASAAAGIKAMEAAEVVMGVAEVYLMGALSVALVVSVTEERAGLEAVRAGWELMRERRVAGWALSGLVLAGSGCIGREMDGGDWGWGMRGEYGREWTVGMRHGYMGGLVVLLGWVVLWSYVVFTVFYCDCKKKIANFCEE